MLTSELFVRVHKYLSGELSLEELEEWIVPRLPIFYALPFSTATELIDEIEFGLAEISDNVRTEHEFKRLLKEFLTGLSMHISYPETDIITQSGFSGEISEEKLSQSDFMMSWAVQ